MAVRCFPNVKLDAPFHELFDSFWALAHDGPDSGFVAQARPSDEGVGNVLFDGVFLAGHAGDPTLSP